MDPSSKMEWPSLPVFVQYVTLSLKTETRIPTYKWIKWESWLSTTEILKHESK